MLISSCYATKLTLAKVSTQPVLPLQAKDRKRKRPQESEERPTPPKPVQKRPRTSPVGIAVVHTFDQSAADGATNNKINPIEYRIRDGRWPKGYFRTRRPDKERS
jgi:hypothetical protein